jgi:hypothetical protein
MRGSFQGGQIVSLIAALLAIEGLAADAEVTAGTGQLARTGWFPFANLHTDTLFECTDHSEREQMKKLALCRAPTIAFRLRLASARIAQTVASLDFESGLNVCGDDLEPTRVRRTVCK